jgi:hypothetical protein
MDISSLKYAYINMCVCVFVCVVCMCVCVCVCVCACLRGDREREGKRVMTIVTVPSIFVIGFHCPENRFFPHAFLFFNPKHVSRGN